MRQSEPIRFGFCRSEPRVVWSNGYPVASHPRRRTIHHRLHDVLSTTPAAPGALAGLLLFGKQPQAFLSHAYISAVRWEGVDAGETIIDRQDITGRLSQQIEHAEAFVLRNTRLSTKIERVRQEDRREYPRAAIREAVVNAVVHRDYSLDGAQTLLYIFDDRLEIRSPGTLPNSVTLDNIRTGVTGDIKSHSFIIAFNINMLSFSTQR